MVGVADTTGLSVGPPELRERVDHSDRSTLAARRSRSWTLPLVGLSVVAGGIVVGLFVFAGGSSDEARQEAALIGDWQANGQVLEAEDSAIQAPGETLQRLWRIQKACARQRCALQLTRQIAGSTSQSIGGALTTPLRWSNGHWLATFGEAHVYCETVTGVGVGIEGSAWNITVIDSRTITAREHTSTGGPGCVTGTTALTWRATKLPAEQVTPA